ncbi:hypothetical protein VVD49_19285 [Uliginosibacterium sp. H3]|uniref:General stress protein 17M-like domain-containing protein n=1 Tax=Uliginosibacterium silvisoli TaxID=3114758 RepID=A0ABU6KAC3_9RHOO|nr:hypothetical protein [Uliginosibacterium sp. H3]
MNESSWVTGLFSDRESAERAYDQLGESGYSSKDIDVLMSEETRNRHFLNDNVANVETELGSKAAEGAGVGGAIGGTVGAVAAALAALGTSLVIPGLGLVVAGPLAAGLAGAGAGAAAGGLVGALVGWRIPEERVKQYEERLRNGDILIGFQPKNEADRQRFHREWDSALDREVLQQVAVT